MSVINKMLRDLEDRQHAVEPSNYIEKDTTNRFMMPLVLVSLVVLASATTYGITQLTYVEQQPVIFPDDDATQEQLDTPQRQMIDEVPRQKRIEIERGPSVVGQEVIDTRLATAEENQNIRQNNRRSPEADEYEQYDGSNAYTDGTGNQGKMVRVSSSQGYSPQIASLRESARIALDNGQPSQAIALLEQIIAIEPQASSARKQLASLLFADKNIVRAFRTLEDGIIIQPDDSSLRLMQARIAYRQGDMQQTQAILLEHPSTAVASTELLSFRAAISEQTGDYQQAYRDYKSLITREPNTAKWWLGQAVSQDKLRLSEDAVKSYRMVQRLNQLSMQVQDFVKTRIDSLSGQS